MTVRVTFTNRWRWLLGVTVACALPVPNTLGQDPYTFTLRQEEHGKGEKSKRPLAYFVVDYVDGISQPPRKVTPRPKLQENANDQDIDRFEAQLDAKSKKMLQRLTPQYEQVRIGELRFLHLVCPLKVSQFRVIEKEVSLSFRRTLIKTVRVQFNRNRGISQPYGMGFPDAQRILEDALLEVVGRELSVEQFATYSKEIAARQKFRKEAGVDMIIAALDRELDLSAHQRQEIRKPILQSWRYSWQNNIQALNKGNQYLPSLPKKEIQKSLSGYQKTIYSTISTGTFYSNGQIVGMPGFMTSKAIPRPLVDELTFVPEDMQP